MTPESVVLTGDCVEIMAGLEPESVDAIVTDPPYGLEFMGKEWDRFGGDARQRDDPTFTQGERKYGLVRSGLGRSYGGDAMRAFRAYQEWSQRWAEAAYRVAKPSAYLLAFGGTRTVHRMTVALEDAGWIIRDMLVWAYASGFPKSKASLKPAWEPIVMARKPGPLRMLAIDECRIPMSGDDAASIEERMDSPRSFQRVKAPSPAKGAERPVEFVVSPAGRWPANVLLTSPIFDGDTEGVVGGGVTPAGDGRDWSDGPVHGSGGVTAFVGEKPTGQHYGDSGTYSRFFLIPKADRADREPVLGGPGERVVSVWGGDEDDLTPGKKSTIPRRNVHPTVKPVELMRHLVRLVTPTGGLVLDPFLGSGTTAIACELEGFRWLGIEKEPEYVAIAEARLNGVQRGMGLSA